MAYDYLQDSIPSDHSRQTRAIVVAERMLKNKEIAPGKILDLGCGTGGTLPVFQRIAPKSSWTGVDIEDSPEVNARTRGGAQFVTYDGVNLPFDDRSFDLVYSNQVLEHVRYPERILAEVTRVLRHKGVFVGQTSQFEPYHSYSYWNFTVYGFKRLVEEAGMKLTELRPGIDGFTLMERHYRGRPPEYSKWFAQESPRNQEIQEGASERPARIANFRKLMYCGQFVFVCEKR